MSTEDKRKHFDWCWSSVLSDFSKENIFFNKKGHLYEYFLSFFNEIFYLEQNKEEKRLEKTLYFIINSFKIPFHIWSWGTINRISIWKSIELVPFVIFGLFVGVYLVKKINDDAYRKLILLLTAVGGVVILFN